jgi:hypothetical protein
MFLNKKLKIFSLRTFFPYEMKEPSKIVSINLLYTVGKLEQKLTMNSIG